MIALTINACGGPLSMRTIVEILSQSFRVRCCTQQARSIEAYQMLPKHQVVVDDVLPRGTIVFVKPETNEELGRIINLYVPN